MDAVEKSVSNPFERFNTPASQDGNPIVKYRGVSKSYGDIQVLKDIDLDIFPSEKVAVIGPSGSGKRHWQECS